MPTEGEFLNNKRYQILRVLSDKGGMGVIYQATDLSFKNTVAIKHSRFTEQFLKQQYPDLTPAQLRNHAAYLRKAFEREARLLRGLDHHAFPKVIDYFMIGDDQFFVMDFVPGKDLDELRKEREQRQPKSFAWEEVRGWVEQLLDALDYLHTQFEPPIIHRDIKPANLKLKPNGQIKLLDFGLAKGAVAEMSVVSRSIPGGTPQYAPLEQMQSQGTDPRSDLYSLAVTLYHLLTGRVPPDAVTRASDTLSRRPDPLRPAHETNPQIPLAISEILQRAAALNPDERPATAAEMREALRRASQPEPVPKTAKPAGKSSKPISTDAPTLPSEPAPIPPGNQSSDASTIGPQSQAAAPEAKQSKIDLSDQSTKPPDSAQPRGNRWKYVAGVVVLAVAIGLMIFLSRNSSAPANASSALTPTRTITDSPTPSASQPAALQSFTEDLGNGVKLEMVRLPGGTFTMGSDYYDGEKPPHQVKVDAFAIGKYEVTQAQWQAVMGSNPSYFKGLDLPVEQVSWDDAVKFCQTLSNKTGKVYRLPTEAEWEYAARAGNPGQDIFSQDVMVLGKYAWYDRTSGGKPQPVGQKKPNAFGLYDMLGNVWEWGQDWYDKDYYQQKVFDNPKGPSSGQYRVMRGGTWASDMIYCRFGYRGISRPDAREIFYGFRVVAAARTP